MAQRELTYHLTDEQMRFFRQNGYLVIKQLIGEPDLVSYKERFLDLCSGKISSSQVFVVKDRSLSKDAANPEYFINKIQDLLHDPVYSTYSENPRLLHILSQLIGDDITAVNYMLINKPPGTTEHPPHQDLVYFPFGPADKIVAAWTSVDPVHKENGCLFVVPGTHTYPILEHAECKNDGKEFFHKIVNWEVIAPEERRVYLEMSPGDTVLFHPNIVHGSLPNNSNVFRKALTCHFASSSCKYIEVAGSRFESTAKQLEQILRKRGVDIKYLDFWRFKTKQVKGVRCNL